VAQAVDVDTETLRKAIKDEYQKVAEDPDGLPLTPEPVLTRLACTA
jgi:hypothetical protein